MASIDFETAMISLGTSNCIPITDNSFGSFRCFYPTRDDVRFIKQNFNKNEDISYFINEFDRIVLVKGDDKHESTSVLA